MISLSDGILAGWGSVHQRHLDYAQHVEYLHIAAYSPAAHGYEVTPLGDGLTVYPSRSRSRLHFLRDALRLGATLLQEHPISLITTQDPFLTGLIGARLKSRTGVALHVQNHSDVFGNRIWLRERWRNRMLHALGQRIIKRADVNRVVNTAEREKYIRMGLTPERVFVCPVPVQFGDFHPQAAPTEAETLRREFNIPPAVPIVLWVGRPVPFKRVPLLVKAFSHVRRHHPGAVLLLIGDFPPEHPARQEVQRLGLGAAVRMPGKVTHGRLPAVYRTSSVYVHSSIYEGFGMVMVEAAACGKPIVATDTAGAAEIVRDGETGLICPQEDAVTLANAVGWMLANPDEAAAMGHAGAMHVRNKFDYSRGVEAIVESWRAAVQS